MDVIRFTYQTSMRLVENQPGVTVRWLKCREGAQPLPFDHRMGSRVWEDDWRGKEDTGEFGEIYGLYPQWVQRAEPPTCAQPQGPYWPTEYRPGVRSMDAYTFPALDMDAEGWPLACCGPAEFVELYPACNEGEITRLPGRFWIKFSPTDPPSCWFSTTVIEMNRVPETGGWYGSADPGPHLIPTEVVYAIPDDFWGQCGVRVKFNVEGLPSGQGMTLGLAHIPGVISPAEVVPNPPYVRWMPAFLGGTTTGIFCDIGPTVVAIGKIELLTSDPNS